MSYLLPHLHSGWAVDQAILAEEERLVIIRFGHDWDETCMQVPFTSLSLSLSVCIYPLCTESVVQMYSSFGRVFFRGGKGWGKFDGGPVDELEKIRFRVVEDGGILMDEVLASVAETIKNFAVIYLVDITEVPDFNTMYELYDPSTIMFFFRNKHIMIDLGTGNNNKINWAMKDKQEFIDIVETVYRGARKGRGLVIAPKDYSTKYRY
ncbi:hypothetical protein RHSIM_Rhsim09G0071200 [Rhododendron simsii]|uniref:Thioredoxin-like protein YLS8 n=2 Tax=Rhododendron simsii TaxID=118357 RepID=A0A834LEQ9_RHOSS|nr:hypothetical protein RHSIM_Rhsim09G0071200 [Rhododendron simsii]